MSKLYVGNINWKTSDDELAEHFRQYGDVIEAKIMLDHETGRSRGFGFVTMGRAEQACVAQEKLDGQSLGDRPLRVNEAHDNGHRRQSPPNEKNKRRPRRQRG